MDAVVATINPFPPKGHPMSIQKPPGDAESEGGKPPTLVQSYDCNEGANCFVQKHMHDYKNLNDLVRGKNRFTDIDGVLDVGGRILFLEVKTGNAILTGVQNILHQNLSSKDDQFSLIVWRNVDGEPTECQWVTDGKKRRRIQLPNGEEDLKLVIQTWMSL